MSFIITTYTSSFRNRTIGAIISRESLYTLVKMVLWWYIQAHVAPREFSRTIPLSLPLCFSPFHKSGYSACLCRAPNVNYLKIYVCENKNNSNALLMPNIYICESPETEVPRIYTLQKRER